MAVPEDHVLCADPEPLHGLPTASSEPPSSPAALMSLLRSPRPRHLQPAHSERQRATGNAHRMGRLPSLVSASWRPCPSCGTRTEPPSRTRCADEWITRTSGPAGARSHRAQAARLGGHSDESHTVRPQRHLRRQHASVDVQSSGRGTRTLRATTPGEHRDLCAGRACAASCERAGDAVPGLTCSSSAIDAVRPSSHGPDEVIGRDLPGTGITSASSGSAGQLLEDRQGDLQGACRRAVAARASPSNTSRSESASSRISVAFRATGWRSTSAPYRNRGANLGRRASASPRP